MRTIRTFVDLPLSPGTLVPLPDSVANHLLRVLRLRDDAEVVLFNGDGNDYSARLQMSGKRAASARVLSSTPVDNESRLSLTLAQGIARGERMDLVLQKATELGVSAIWPLQTGRTEVKLDEERLGKRMAHWRGVIISACEQCGRARVPQLAEPISIEELAAGAPLETLRLTLDPVCSTAIADLPAPASAGVLLAIGPEGGFSEAERQRLGEAGFLGVRLGPRVLRTETAGLAALAVLQSRFGDLL